MRKRKKIEWKFGDVFLIPLKNDLYGIGQVLDLQMENIVRCALYNETVNSPADFDIEKSCLKDNLISLVASTREQLDYGVWEVKGSKKIEIPKKDYPNEKFRGSWIGAKHFDAGLLEDFLKAYHKIIVWDDWFNPNYLDQFLVDISKKPKELLLKKT
jgi:hypothetical protein